MVPDHRSHAGSGGRTPSRELPHDASASGDAERHPVGGRTSTQMIRRSARLHRRPRWRHSRHVFRRRQPLPRMPLPVLVVPKPEPEYWPRFCAALGKPEWVDDPRYCTMFERRKVTQEITGMIQAVFAD